MVPSLMLSATVLHPLSPVPKTGSRSEPNQEVLYSCLMTAQRINGNCLSRSTKIFLISINSSSCYAVFCGTLLFPSDFTLLCGYTESFLFLSLSHSHLVFFHLVISLSRPDHRHYLCCRTKLQNAAPPPIGGIPQSSCCMFVDNAWCVVEKEDGES